MLTPPRIGGKQWKWEIKLTLGTSHYLSCFELRNKLSKTKNYRENLKVLLNFFSLQSEWVSTFFRTDLKEIYQVFYNQQ